MLGGKGVQGYDDWNVIALTHVIFPHVEYLGISGSISRV